MKTRQMPSLCLCLACQHQMNRKSRVRRFILGFLRVLAIYALVFVLMMAALIYVANTAPTLQ